VNAAKMADPPTDADCNFIRRFFGLFGSVATFLPDDIIDGIFDFGKELLMRKYDVHGFWDSVLQFMEKLVDVKPELVTQQFTPVSFYFALAPGFDPTRPAWYPVVFRTLRLHGRIYGAKCNYQGFSQAIVTGLEALGLGQESCDLYLRIVEQDIRAAPMDLGRFAMLLMLTKNGKAWD
jgi:hypothetical protein